ncbi:hypothetical protein TNCV_4323141 [Trichonephila clavipes]|nr:hypothetical protein TNCV_4323141 [Trichonephila clavipes]
MECRRTQLEVSEELGIAQSVISRLWQRFQDDVLQSPEFDVCEGGDHSRSVCSMFSNGPLLPSVESRNGSGWHLRLTSGSWAE